MNLNCWDCEQSFDDWDGYREHECPERPSPDSGRKYVCSIGCDIRKNTLDEPPESDRFYSEEERIEQREQKEKEDARARRKRTGDWVFRGYK